MLTIAQALQIARQHHTAGRLAEAESFYRKILAACPEHAESLHLLGMVAHQTGRNADALGLLQRSIAARSEEPSFHNNLGVVLRAEGKVEEAIAAFRTALRCNASFADAHGNLGRALAEQGRFAEGAESSREAIRLNPRSLTARYNLGLALTLMRDLDGAEAAYREILRLDPRQSQAEVHLACLEHARGDHDASIARLRRAVAAEPANAARHSQLLFYLQCHPGQDRETLLREHREWNTRHAAALTAAAAPHPRADDPERPLRIGYVSRHLSDNVVGWFFLILLENHDRARFKICAYSDSIAEEFATRMRDQSDLWRDTRQMNDAAVAELIRADHIDILVDLAAHSVGHRLLTFARKPAPVQVTYLAYCATTGLEAMDYVLTDPHMDPPDKGGAGYSERLSHLPECYWSYRPPIATPPAGPLPALAAGYVTFGCLNNFCKVTSITLALWRRLLLAVPESRLLLHSDAGRHRQRILDYFAAGGVSGARLSFIGYLARAEYFATYQQIDIALDPFPFGGGATSCDALWMGVPVVTLVGDRALSRGSLTLLANLGLEEFAAHSEDAYVHTAAALAGDLPRLETLRTSLRPRMQASPITDGPRFTRHLEAAYRTMWREWCGRP